MGPRSVKKASKFCRVAISSNVLAKKILTHIKNYLEQLKNKFILYCIFTAQVLCRFYYICKEPHCNAKPSPFFSCHSFFFCQCAFPITAPYPHRFPRKSVVTRFGKTQLLHRRTCRRTHEYCNRSALSRNPPSNLT